VLVGIDVHKHFHVAALLDERGGELGTLAFANPAGGAIGGCCAGWPRRVPLTR
jgi:hypothetical protein